MRYVIIIIAAVLIVTGSIQIISYLTFRTINFFNTEVAQFVVEQIICNENKCQALITMSDTSNNLSILIPVDSSEIHVGNILKVSK